MTNEQNFAEYDKASAKKIFHTHLGNLVIFSVVLLPFFLHLFEAPSNIVNFSIQISNVFAYGITILAAIVSFTLYKFYKNDEQLKIYTQKQVMMNAPFLNKKQIAFDGFIGLLFVVTLIVMNFYVCAIVYFIAELVVKTLNLSYYDKKQQIIKELLTEKNKDTQ